MKLLVIALTLATATPTGAQVMSEPLPRTVPLNDAQGKQIGTVTPWGARMYIRDLKGEHIGTVVIAADGTRTLLDPSGNMLDRIEK